MHRLVDLLLLCLGLLLLVYGGYLLALRHRPIAPVQATELNASVSSPTTPTRIEISALSLSLPIYPSAIVDGKWQTTSQGVSYLSSSSLPGEVGNTIMYGHNWPNLLGGLGKVKPGDTIDIYLGDKQLTYRVEYVATVSSADSVIKEDSTDARLTLYTCTGWLDSKRLVVSARLVQ